MKFNLRLKNVVLDGQLYCKNGLFHICYGNVNITYEKHADPSGGSPHCCCCNPGPDQSRPSETPVHIFAECGQYSVSKRPNISSNGISVL